MIRKDRIKNIKLDKFCFFYLTQYVGINVLKDV